MTNKVTILVGTITGTAEMVANDVADLLTGRGHDVEVLDMEGLDASVFQRPGSFILCTSTYGQGDVPDNAQGLLDDLEASAPDLSGIAYGIIGLGDSTYSDTFCAGGKRFDERLKALRATPVLPRLDHDAGDSVMPEDAGVAWASRWPGEISALAA